MGTNGMKIKTVEGSNVTAFVQKSGVTFQGGAKTDIAKVVQANAEATNGVAHVIDAILIPNGFVPPHSNSTTPMSTTPDKKHTTTASPSSGGVAAIVIAVIVSAALAFGIYFKMKNNKANL